MDSYSNYHDFMNARFKWHLAFMSYLIEKINLGEPITIGTHNERFHCDEIMGIAILETLITQLKGSCTIHRTDRRDEAMLSNMDILVDIGGKFDPAKGRFDHHQTGGAGYRINKRSQLDIPFSSCGLVWYSCGLILTGEEWSVEEHSYSSPIFDIVEHEIIRGICASDSGSVMPNGFKFKGPDNYYIETYGSPMHISKQVGQYNSDDVRNHQEQYQQFIKALNMLHDTFDNTLRSAETCVADKKHLQEELLKKRDQEEVLVLQRSVRWEQHLNELDRNGLVKIILAPRGEDGVWSLYLADRGKRPCTVTIPPEWRGKRDGEFVGEHPITKGILFCHDNRNMINTVDKESALGLTNFLLTKIGNTQLDTSIAA